MEKIKNTFKQCNKNVVDKFIKLLKPNEKFSSKMCMTTIQSYGSLSQNFLLLPC